MSEIWDVILRTALGFVLLIIIVRLLGNKQLGQLNIFTYITGIVIGNMAGEMIAHRDVKIIDGVIGMALWGMLSFFVEVITLKNARARILLDGEPVIVIKNGRIDAQRLKKLRLNIDDLTMMMRTNHVFSVADIDYAVLEPNGELSILKKQRSQTVTKEELSIDYDARRYIPTEIISDGKIVEKNLAEYGLTQPWVMEMLQQQGVYHIHEVLYAELQENGQLYVQKRAECRRKRF